MAKEYINETTKTVATGGALVVANTVVIGLSADDTSWAGTQGSALLRMDRMK